MRKLLSIVFALTIPGTATTALSFAAVTIPVPAYAQSLVNLSGIWQAPTGATFYIRQVNDEIFWLAENNTVPNSGYTHVFHGKVTYPYVSGTFADVPKDPSSFTGGLTFFINSSGNRLVLTWGIFGITQLDRLR